MNSGTPRTKKVFVALSGGVDSSVAALMLKQKGYDLVGVYMRPWSPFGRSPAGRQPCLWERDRADALRIATHLDIPFETWDFSRAYARSVSQPMVREYRSGRTPNPDVECNRHIKFGLFYQKALARGADAIATGHYAQIRIRDGRAVLSAARDTSKDQTYFLWAVDGAHLPSILFPVGGMLKSQVREKAKAAGLLTATKKDSQGVCFVGPLDMKSYLLSVVASKPGAIMHVNGRTIGTHDGAAYYTIGQRHGLDIRLGGGPYYVVAKDMKKNTITVGPASALERNAARISDIHWIGKRPEPGAILRAQIRYRSPKVPVRLTGSRVTFLRPVTAIAPGQSIVFYQGPTVLGGAFLV